MSNNSIKVTLTVAPENELFARRGLQKGGRVQKYIDSEVLRCCDSYVPMLTSLDKGTQPFVVCDG